MVPLRTLSQCQWVSVRNGLAVGGVEDDRIKIGLGDDEHAAGPGDTSHLCHHPLGTVAVQQHALRATTVECRVGERQGMHVALDEAARCFQASGAGAGLREQDLTLVQTYGGAAWADEAGDGANIVADAAADVEQPSSRTCLEQLIAQPLPQCGFSPSRSP